MKRRKKRKFFYGHLKRLDFSRLTKQIFDILDRRSKTSLKRFPEVKKDLQELNINQTSMNTATDRKSFMDAATDLESLQEKVSGKKN